MNSERIWLPLRAVAYGLSLLSATTTAAEDEALVDRRSPLVIDFLAAAYLPATDGIVVAGPHGLVGTMKVNTTEGVAVLTKFPDAPKEDFTTLEKWSDSEVLLGSSSGKIFLYDGKKATELAALSEWNEPVLDIAVANGKAWAVGARGMLAKSEDGKKWEAVEVKDVEQPLINLPGANASEWYFGVSNLLVDTVQFTAMVGGQPAVADQDYTLYPDEGFLQVAKDLDADPAPAISFRFNAGPAFRPGDVTWNVVLFDGNQITIAGEFGMILQSTDGGSSWIRRDAVLTAKEPEPPYWLAGVQRGTSMYLAGAAGVIRASNDSGATWTPVPPPGAEGVFGIAVLPSGQPAVAGAVGLIGVLNSDAWALADRTELQLLSWLKTPVEMPDGTLIMLGGRSTAIAYKGDKWVRIPVSVNE